MTFVNPRSEFFFLFFEHDAIVSNRKAIATVWLHTANDLYLVQVEA